MAGSLGTRHVELDAVIHQENWVDLKVAEFRQRVGELATGSAWVIDGNYRNVRDLVWARADTVVWLDLPRRVVMITVIRRTLHGVRTRRELWNGNRENLPNALSLDPYHSIVVWTWVDQRRYQASYRDARGDPTSAHLRFVRVQRKGDRASLLAEARAARQAERTRIG